MSKNKILSDFIKDLDSAATDSFLFTSSGGDRTVARPLRTTDIANVDAPFDSATALALIDSSFLNAKLGSESFVDSDANAIMSNLNVNIIPKNRLTVGSPTKKWKHVRTNKLSFGGSYIDANGLDGGNATLSTFATPSDYSFTQPPVTNVQVGGLGFSAGNAASDIAALKAAGITTDGMYWFDNSISNGTPFQAYVKFNYVDGNDWYLLLKVHNQGDMTSGNSLWTNTTLQNETDDNLTSGNFSKYATWNNIDFNYLMMEMHQSGTAKYPPIMNFTTTRTFAEAITAAGGATAASGYNNTVAANSTSPSYSGGFYHDAGFEYYGNTFTNTGLYERYVQNYGIAMWGNNSSQSTSAEGYSSTGRSGAWIGCPLDNNGHTFGNNTNSGSDSGFGFGASGGNSPKTTSAGYCEWNGTSSTNTLPGYVWIR